MKELFSISCTICFLKANFWFTLHFSTPADLPYYTVYRLNGTFLSPNANFTWVNPNNLK